MFYVSYHRGWCQKEVDSQRHYRDIFYSKPIERIEIRGESHYCRPRLIGVAKNRGLCDFCSIRAREPLFAAQSE